MIRATCIALGMAACMAMLAGCKPSTANTQLRKENAQLQSKAELLERQHAGDIASIHALEGSATRPAVTEDVLQRLYTAHGLNFGKLTGGYKDNDKNIEDTGVVVHVIPTDQQGQNLKAAGSFLVTLFDLSVPEKPLVGKRAFSLDEAKANWYGQALLFNYVLKVPFQTQPKSRNILVRVEYTDELTHRKIVAEKNVTVNP